MVEPTSLQSAKRSDVEKIAGSKRFEQAVFDF
jgi:hypothetical protein